MTTLLLVSMAKVHATHLPAGSVLIKNAHNPSRFLGNAKIKPMLRVIIPGRKVTGRECDMIMTMQMMMMTNTVK